MRKPMMMMMMRPDASMRLKGKINKKYSKAMPLPTQSNFRNMSMKLMSKHRKMRK